jgi:hypothetical protein
MIRTVTAAALLIGICRAPVARADADGDQVYLDAIHGNYFSRTHTDSEWLAEARRICDAHLSGTDDDQLFDMVQADLNVPDNVAASVVGSAEGALGC